MYALQTVTGEWVSNGINDDGTITTLTVQCDRLITFRKFTAAVRFMESMSQGWQDKYMVTPVKVS